MKSKRNSAPTRRRMRPIDMASQPNIEDGQPTSQRRINPAGEDGFMLLFVVVMVFLVLIALAAAAPVVAHQLRRDKEIESQHRMEQYVRAIQLYQRQMPGQYPPSIKALENTNNIRFLRHQYVDPLTGKKDYKLIHQGEQKTKIHVFFGQELAGLAASLGSAQGMQSSGGMGTPMGGGATTVTSGNALSAGMAGATIGGPNTPTTPTSGPQTATSGADPGTDGTTGTNPGTSSPTSSTSSSSSPTSSTGMFGDDSTGSPIVGVGTSRSGDSVTDPNGQSTYDTWEFWYDPRIEMLRQGVDVTGGGMSSQSASSFGANGATGQPNSGAGAPGSPFGSSPGSSGNGFGSSSPGSSNTGFGSSGSGFGSSSPSTNSPGSNNSSGSTNPNSSVPNPF